MRRLRLFLLLLLVAVPCMGGWSRAGLFGADVRALIADPRDPDRLFLGTTEGEVYVSNDGGVSWSNPRAGIPFPDYIVDNLVIDARGRLWAAAWGLWGGGVIAFSADGGVTWTRRDAGLHEISLRAFAVDPSNPDSLIAGGLTGVFRSHDAGRTWTKISDRVNVESVAVDPRASDTIYVGTWRQAWRTDDGGKTWKHIAQGMVLDTDVFAINIDANNPDDVWLSTCGWVYRSTDRGENWTRYRDGFSNRRIHAIERHPEDPERLYAGSVAGLYQSCNLGKSWELVSDDSLVINAIALHPDRPNRILLGTEGDGVYVSHDNGKSFARSVQGLYNVRVAAVVPDPTLKGVSYAAVLFGGKSSGIYRSSDAGVSWQRLSKSKLPEILSFAVQSGSDVRFVAGTEKGFFWSQNGVEWSQAEPSAAPIRVEKIVVYNGLRLFAATAEGVYTSKDSGMSWYRLAAFDRRALDIALGQLGGMRALYALTSDGLYVFDGSVWERVNGAPKGRSVAVRKDGNVEIVFVAGTNGMAAGHVDYMKRWHAADVPLRAIAAHQTARNAESIVLLSSRGEHELYLGNGDASWQRLKVPFDSADVTSFAADPFDAKRYLIGTLGQGLFVYRHEPRNAPASDVLLGGGGSQ